VTTLQARSTTPVIRRRTYESVALWALVLLTIVSILVCLPAFHTATGLHHNAETLDAFDLGINVPDTTRGSLPVVALSALLLAGLWHERELRPLPGLRVSLALQVTRRRSIRRRMRSARLHHHASGPRSSSGDSDSSGPSSMLRMAMTPRISAKGCGIRGVLHCRASRFDHADSTNRRY